MWTEWQSRPVMRKLWAVAFSAMLILTTTLLVIVALYAGFLFSSAQVVRLADGIPFWLFIVGNCELVSSHLFMKGVLKMLDSLSCMISWEVWTFGRLLAT